MGPFIVGCCCTRRYLRCGGCSFWGCCMQLGEIIANLFAAVLLICVVALVFFAGGRPLWPDREAKMGHPLAAGCHENGIGQGAGARSPARRLRYKNGAAKAPIPIAGGPAPSRPRRDPAEMGVRANPPLLSRKGGEAGLPPMKGRARRAGTAAIVRGRQLSSIAAAAKTMRVPKAGATSQRAA